MSKARSNVWNLRDITNVKDPAYGAKGDGVANDTAAINAALASGKDLYFPAGTYLTTGGHVQSTIGQRVFGAGHMWPGLGGTGTTIKKSSGTAVLWALNGHNGGLRDLTLDGNNLAGNILQVNTKYLHLANLILSGQGGTDFAMLFNSVNSSLFENIFFTDGNYGCIKTNGVAAMLYCTFNSISMGATTGPYAIDLTNAFSNTFNGLVIETPLRIGADCQNLNFNGFSSETEITGTKLIEITASTSININFNGFRVLSTGLRTVPLVDVANAQGVHFKNVHITDTVSVGTPVFFALDTVRNFSIRDATCYIGAAFDFVKCNSAGGNNLNVTIDNVMEVNSTSGGTCRWVTQGLDVRNCGFAQAFYAGTFKRVAMTNVYGAINTANIDAAALVSLHCCDSVLDNGLAVLHNCTLSTGARVTNGYSKTTELTIPNAATALWGGAISAGIVIKGVTTLVTQAITGAGGFTGYSIGHSLAVPGADVDAWGANQSPALGESSNPWEWTVATPVGNPNNSNYDIILTAVGANFDGGAGKVRITMVYDKFSSPIV